MQTPTTQRAEAIADHMDSFGAYTQGREVIALALERDALVHVNSLLIDRDKIHERRVQDLLEANNAYLERARAAEARAKELEDRIDRVKKRLT